MKRNMATLQGFPNTLILRTNIQTTKRVLTCFLEGVGAGGGVFFSKESIQSCLN